jgi:hypothetical protein
MRRLPCLALLAALAVLPACKDDSYAVVSVLALSGTIEPVAQFRVYVGNDADADVLLYPKQPKQAGKTLVLDASRPVTFSVEFSRSRGGPVSFGVEALDPQGVVLGYGQSQAVIAKGKVFRVTVYLESKAVRPPELDGGTGLDSGTVDVGAGLDGGGPIDGGGRDARDSSSALACDPYQPALACGAGKTCGLLCDPGKPAVGMCYAAGAGNPGSACDKNDDCLPGTQCFTFSAVGCQVKTCLRFCNNDDAACGEPGAFCNVPIQCGTTTPPFLACSRPCDPTGAASVGCAPGLTCFVYGDDTTDCACAGVGVVGATCTQNQGCSGELGCTGCAAGTSCVVPAGAGAAATGTCRPICRLAAPACPTGTTCIPFTNSTRKLFGFCQ